MGSLYRQGASPCSGLRTGAVLLAADEGQRIGGVAKPLIRLQGLPLLRRHLVALGSAGIDEIVVVTGYAHSAVEAQVQDFGAILAHNEEHARGQDSSVRCGLASLKGRFDAVLVMPADLPLISAGDIAELIGAFKSRATAHVVVPMVHGRRGNPIVLDHVALVRILESGMHLGCRHLIAHRPEFVLPYETTNERFITQLDTIEDVEGLERRTGWRLELPRTRV